MTPTTLASTVQRNSSEEKSTRNGKVAGNPLVRSCERTSNGDSVGARIRARMYPETASPPAADTSIIRRICSFSKSSPHPFSFALARPGSPYCGDVVDAVDGGFHLRVIIPPTIPRTDPTMKPPKPKKPRMLKTSTSMPHVCRWLGLRRSSTADIVTMLMVTRNMSKSTIKAPPTRASIDGMFGYSTAVFDDILDLLPPALPCVEDGGNTLGETILIQPVKGPIGIARKCNGWKPRPALDLRRKR